MTNHTSRQMILGNWKIQSTRIIYTHLRDHVLKVISLNVRKKLRLSNECVKSELSHQMKEYLVISIRPLLWWLWWPRLCGSVSPILLALSLWIIGILRSWTTLGRAWRCKCKQKKEKRLLKVSGRRGEQ